MSENLQTKLLSRAWHFWKFHSSSENAPTREQALLKYGIALFAVVSNPVYFLSSVSALRYVNRFFERRLNCCCASAWIRWILITSLALRICELLYLSVQIQNDLDAVAISNDNQFMLIYIKNSLRWCKYKFIPSDAQLCHVIVLLFCCLYLRGTWFAPWIHQFNVYP